MDKDLLEIVRNVDLDQARAGQAGIAFEALHAPWAGLALLALARQELPAVARTGARIVARRNKGGAVQRNGVERSVDRPLRPRAPETERPPVGAVATGQCEA